MYVSQRGTQFVNSGGKVAFQASDFGFIGAELYLLKYRFGDLPRSTDDSALRPTQRGRANQIPSKAVALLPGDFQAEFGFAPGQHVFDTIGESIVVCLTT